jgi:excisionase family DNA binding protein
MGSTALKQDTYLPGDAGEVARVYDFLRAHEAAGRERPEPRYFLAGSEPGDRVELPAEVYRVLHHVVEALRQGVAVTVAPMTQKLTTQQAADLLGVSRPTVVKLLNEKKIPYEQVGTHRRILLRDLLQYREKRRAAQYAALEATAASLGDEEDVDTTLERLREARRAVASRRRNQPET